MSVLERIRDTRYLKYAIPNSLTAARPVLGARGMVAAWRGDWAAAERNFAAGFATDFEGGPARICDAISEAGSKLDPISDWAIRVEALAAFFPSMNKAVFAGIVGAEIANLGMNRRIQRGRRHAYIPQEAKDGSAMQATGAIAYMEGMRRRSLDLKEAGEIVMSVGTANRTFKYVELFRHPDRIPAEISTDPSIDQVAA